MEYTSPPHPFISLSLSLSLSLSISLYLSLSPFLQLYKQTVHNTVAEFIPLTMKTIILQPSAKARQAPDFNREAYVDFVAVQIKFLSFLAYIIRIYQDQVSVVEGGRGWLTLYKIVYTHVNARVEEYMYTVYLLTKAFYIYMYKNVCCPYVYR